MRQSGGMTEEDCLSSGFASARLGIPPGFFARVDECEWLFVGIV